MDLHGRLGDIDLPRDAFVGIAFDQAAHNRFLLLGDSILWCVDRRIAVAARFSLCQPPLRLLRPRMKEMPPGKRLLPSSRALCVATCDIDKIAGGAGTKCRNQFALSIVIGHDGNTPGGMAILFQRRRECGCEYWWRPRPISVRARRPPIPRGRSIRASHRSRARACRMRLRGHRRLRSAQRN